MASAYLQTRDLVQGASYSDTISITDSDGLAINLEGGSGEDVYSAIFQIRAASVDSGASALVSLTDLDGIVLGDGLLTITLSPGQTETIVSATTADHLWAELDLNNETTGEMTTLQWRMKIRREYAREAV